MAWIYVTAIIEVIEKPSALEVLPIVLEMKEETFLLVTVYCMIVLLVLS